MTKKITVNQNELTGITDELEQIIQSLEEAANEIETITTTDYYSEGKAEGQVSLFSVMTVRMNELIAHYARIKEYVSYAGNTFVELDTSISKDIDGKEK